jgi:hypothetical protein
MLYIEVKKKIKATPVTPAAFFISNLRKRIGVSKMLPARRSGSIDKTMKKVELVPTSRDSFSIFL